LELIPRKEQDKIFGAIVPLQMKKNIHNHFQLFIDFPVITIHLKKDFVHVAFRITEILKQVLTPAKYRLVASKVARAVDSGSEKKVAGCKS
jgi:hypothetical protein